MQTLMGNFTIHRIKTEDGRNAVMVVPMPISEVPLSYSFDDQKDEFADISFELATQELAPVHPADSYLTLLYPDDMKIHLGPYVPSIT